MVVVVEVSSMEIPLGMPHGLKMDAVLALAEAALAEPTLAEAALAEAGAWLGPRHSRALASKAQLPGMPSGFPTVACYVPLQLPSRPVPLHSWAMLWPHVADLCAQA